MILNLKVESTVKKFHFTDKKVLFTKRKPFCPNMNTPCKNLNSRVCTLKELIFHRLNSICKRVNLSLCIPPFTFLSTNRGG